MGREQAADVVLMAAATRTFEDRVEIPPKFVMLCIAVFVAHVALAIAINSRSAGVLLVLAALVVTVLFLVSWGNWIDGRRHARLIFRARGKGPNPRRLHDFIPLLVMLSGPLFTLGAMAVFGAA